MENKLPAHIPALANLALDKRISATDLCNIALALRTEFPRYETLSIAPDIELGDPQETLPVYCFGCGKTKGEIQGGYLRESCSHCHKDRLSQNFPQRNAALWTLFSTTGYPVEYWTYLILKQARGRKMQ